jgi:hypothetical protein
LTLFLILPYWNLKTQVLIAGRKSNRDGGRRRVDMVEQQEKKEGVIKRFTKATREFIYGMVAYDTVQLALKTRGSLEHLFILITMGDLLGVPILRPYYSLRILPYVVPMVATWKRKMLQERDITDALAKAR